MGRKIYESPSMRHRHQRGSLSPAGRTSRKYWLGRWHEYRTVNGKEVRHPCTANLGCCSQVKKWEARKELDKLVAASQNTKAKPEAKTVGWFWENRFIAARSAGWEEPTAKGNKSDYRLYIMPALHEANLADVDRYRCQNHIDELAARGISRSVISRVKVLMSSIFREALYDDLIPKNPMERVKLPKDCVVPCNATIPREQLENLLAHVSDLRDWTILAIAIFGELRSEELFALTWPCVGPDYVDIQDTCWRGEVPPRQSQDERFPAHGILAPNSDGGTQSLARGMSGKQVGPSVPWGSGVYVAGHLAAGSHLSHSPQAGLYGHAQQSSLET